MIKRNPTSTDYYKTNFTFFKNARAAWNYIIMFSKPKNLLLPSYIGITEKEGSGIFDPVVANKLDFEFYNLTENLEIDLIDLNKKLESKLYDTLLVVHYFGFVSKNYKKVEKICSKLNIKIIEDCAHLFRIKNLNKKNERKSFASFYSLHKYFPINYGGILESSQVKYDKDSDLNSEEENSLFKIILNSNFKKIKTKRIENYYSYIKYFAQIEGIKILRLKLNEFDIPQTFPVLIKNNLREKLYFKLKENNIDVVALYYRLINEIDRAIFVNPVKISESILNFPIHQDINEAQIAYSAEKVKILLKSLNE